MPVVRRSLQALILAVVAATGCSTLGPQTIRGDRFNYNESGAESSKEQLLLNLVRLRYGEPLYFLEVASMVSQFKIEAAGSISAFKNDLHGALGPALRTSYGVDGEPSRQTTVGGNLGYSDSPTITYRPLQGEAFSKRVMTAITPTVMIALSQSGWRAERVMRCCVQRINGISNRTLHDSEAAITADTTNFDRLMVLFNRLQDTGHIQFVIEMDKGLPTAVCYVPDVVPEVEAEMIEVRRLLGYPERGAMRLRITGNARPLAPDELAIQTRSLLATMYAMAQEFDVPDKHTEDKQVGAPRSDQTAWTWIRIEHSRFPQPDPYVQVLYNGYWFYIAKSDWSSKRTFALLTYLFSLQAADLDTQAAPLITVGAGR